MNLFKLILIKLGIITVCSRCGGDTEIDEEKFNMGYGIDRICARCGERQK